MSLHDSLLHAQISSSTENGSWHRILNFPLGHKLLQIRNTCLGKFGQKIKILWLCLTKLARLPQMYWIRWWCSHFLFALERLYFRQIWSKIDSCLTWIFCSLTNSNMQNSMLIFSFLGIRLEILFFGIIWSKIQNCFFNENFGI